jgi:hypothetical protein
MFYIDGCRRFRSQLGNLKIGLTGLLVSGEKNKRWRLKIETIMAGEVED